MRVAMLQLAIGGRSRAADQQRICRAINRAASEVEAPDLVVLPGAVDAAAVVGTRGLRRATMMSFAETLSAKAREWGVYIAAGLHRRSGGRMHHDGVLFDPDGDLCARASRPDERADQGGWPSRVGSPLGAICLRQPGGADCEAPVADATDCACLHVVSLDREARGRIRSDRHEAVAALLLRDAPAARGDRLAVVVAAEAEGGASRPGDLTSFVCDHAGRVLVVARDSAECVFCMDVFTEACVCP